MKKRLLTILPILALVLTFTGCGCEHEWNAATCSAPKTCSLCGKTEGEALPHTWTNATCTDAKTCSVCGATEGEALGHTWTDATCTTLKTCSVCKAEEGELAAHTWTEATCSAPKTCSVCKTTEGTTIPHKWEEATTSTPKTCSACKKTEGSRLITDSRFTTSKTKELQGSWYSDVTLTDEMMGLENFGNVDVRLNLTFGNTGSLTQTLSLKNKDDYMAKLKKYTVDTMYASFASQGYTKEEGDQAMIDTYGLNVNDYVDAYLKNYDVNAAFKAFTFQEVYYVEKGTVYTALSWSATFEENKYTLENGKLKIEGLSLEDGGEALVWTKG